MSCPWRTWREVLPLRILTISMVEAVDSKANQTLKMITEWMRSKDLHLVTENMEAGVYKAPGKRHLIQFVIMDDCVIAKSELKYLGLMVEDQCTPEIQNP